MIHNVDRTIHEPARLLLLIYLYSVEKADFTFLKKQKGMTQGNLSSHLNKLEAAGFLSLREIDAPLFQGPGSNGGLISNSAR